MMADNIKIMGLVGQLCSPYRLPPANVCSCFCFRFLVQDVWRLAFPAKLRMVMVSAPFVVPSLPGLHADSADRYKQQQGGGEWMRSSWEKGSAVAVARSHAWRRPDITIDVG